METFLEEQETGNKKNNLFTVSKVESGGDSGFSKDQSERESIRTVQTFCQDKPNTSVSGADTGQFSFIVCLFPFNFEYWKYQEY